MTEARVSRTRVFHVTNRGSDSEESEDEGRPNGIYPYRFQAQTQGRGIGTGTGTGIGTSLGTGTGPAPLTTNIPPRGPRYQPSHHSLSSPSSTSSPAADESTPPPSTPGLSAPPVDLTADVADSSFDLPTTRTNRIIKTLKSPFHHKSPRSAKRPATSPTASTPDSYSNPSAAFAEKINILVTADSEKYVNVDITGAKSPAFIRECVFSKLNIYDDEDQSRFSIYQTEIGAYATSEALSDERLFELCRTLGDSKGTLKLLVSHSSATVHEQPYSVRPLPSVSPPSVGTIPPPVLPEQSAQPYPPLRPKRRSGSRREGSISSASEHIPMDSTGYDADLDNPDRDNRSTIRPQMLNTIVNTVSPPSPLTTRRPGAPLPSRPNSPPPTPPTAPLPQPPTDRKDPGSTTTIDRFGNVVPVPPPPPPLSPNKATFPINEDNSLTPPANRTHRRSGSDVAAEREQSLTPEHQYELRQWRSRPKQESPQLREGHRERPRANVLQRPDHEDSLARSVDSWVFVSKHDSAGTAAAATRGEQEQLQQQAPPAPAEQSRRSPASGTSRGARSHVSPSRFKPSPSYSTRLAIPAPPRNPPPNVPAGTSESRLPLPSRNAGQVVPANWAVVWKGEEKSGEPKPLSSSSSHSKWHRLAKGAKSMDELRAAFSGSGSGSIMNHPPTLQPGDRSRRGQNQIPISARANGSITFMPGSFGGQGSGTLSKAYESTRQHVRPLPMHGGGTQDFPSSVSSSYAVNNRYGSSTSSGNGYMSPNQEPYARPSSAFGDSVTSPTTRVQRQYQSPTYGADAADSVRSPRAVSPTMPFGIMGSRSATALVDSSGSANVSGDSYNHTQTASSSSSRTPPRSPTSPRSPRLFPHRLSDGSHVSSAGSTGSGSSDSTLRKGDHQWLAKMLNDSGVNGLASEATLVPLRHPHPLPDPLSASSASSSSLPSSSTLTSSSPIPSSSASTSSSSTLAKSPPSSIPFRSFDTSSFSPYYGAATNMTTGTFDDSDSDDLWNKPLGPVPTNKSLLARPALTVQIENSNGVVKPVSIPSSTSSSSQQVISGLPSSSSTPTPLRRPSSPSSETSGNEKGRIRGSTFTTEDIRPLPEDMYEKLDQYFPEHDLDKPVIEACSGGTSPTTVEPSPSVPPLPPIPPDKDYPRSERERDYESKDKGRIRGKKSIRIVAQEHKKRIDRSSMASSYSANNANMMRKRSTKLWGSKLEEVITGTHGKSSAAVTPDSPSGGPTTFKWVRGELIGKGTYGSVYLALNATTGEMMAVKQVDIPRTASDKNNSRQTNVVQALKMESETLKDLDHPNIVQYLGFEETPSNLSIFLEYVPGGSIGSVLLRHGKFAEDVTKSFTSQILSGLEYLHSKGILHRDLKADNILVEMSGICKISDFGISKRTAEDAGGGAATAMQGTVFWMAPEVVNPQGKAYNFKVDIWSVGCVVLEMWAGMRPWMGDEMVAVMFKLYSSKLAPPVPKDVVLSELADDFRKKCFAINPDERPSATELRKHKYLELPPGWVFNGFT